MLLIICVYLYIRWLFRGEYSRFLNLNSDLCYLCCKKNKVGKWKGQHGPINEVTCSESRRKETTGQKGNVESEIKKN